MPISKGFLRSSSGYFNRQWILTGILLGLLTALVLYAFSIQFMELFRLFAYELMGNVIILKQGEIVFYNFFYAAIASIVGASAGLQFLIQNSIRWSEPKLKVSAFLILKNQYFNIWNWLYFYGKAFILAGILFWTLPIHYDIDFYSEYYYFFIAFALLMYLNLWQDMYRLLRRRLLKCIFITTVLIIANCLLITRLNIVDHTKINTIILSKTISYKYRVTPPKTEAMDINSDFGTVKSHIYIGFSQYTDTLTPRIILKDYKSSHFSSVDQQDLVYYLKEESDRVDAYFAEDHIVALHIDGAVKMHFVNELKDILKANNFRRIRYVSTPRFSRYPANYPGFDKYGLNILLPVNCDFITGQVDSLKALGYSGSQVRFPDLPCYFGAEIKNYNRVKLDINPDSLLLNGNPVTPQHLSSFVYSLFKKYEQNALVLLKINPESTFEQYMQAMDLLRKPVLQLRNLEAIKLTGEVYSSLPPYDFGYNTMKQIKDRYPFNFYEMSEADSYLYDFVK
ncbi:hypothetical protein GCM10009122_36420 [Fulvivirga kasyanovii]|uniref:Uncharacterized protein n=1 Tax=Fulvivirga kasyanovii TaxID=396812 RepID=A0ABW9RY16_9BACT|nr:hypothetical protein [Fulvivirga kasyanovii]MTI29132.1 hypothetical protein [Fulvivirga kasyanovii]